MIFSFSFKCQIGWIFMHIFSKPTSREVSDLQAQLQEDFRFTFSWSFSYISFSSFTFPGAPYWIFILFLPWLPSNFYLVVIEHTNMFHRKTCKYLAWKSSLQEQGWESLGRVTLRVSSSHDETDKLSSLPSSVTNDLFLMVTTRIVQWERLRQFPPVDFSFFLSFLLSLCIFKIEVICS